MCPQELREEPGYIKWRRLREEGSIYVPMGKPSSLLRQDFPVWTFLEWEHP
jgi:predicted component of type VI protein secretion system